MTLPAKLRPEQHVWVPVKWGEGSAERYNQAEWARKVFGIARTFAEYVVLAEYKT